MRFIFNWAKAGLWLALWGVAGVAWAQSNWPRKPIRIIVPIAAGGVTDAIVRKAAPTLAQRLGQPLVIENIAGANGVIGGDACARANPDGHTLCVLNTGVTSVNPILYDKHPFDPTKAFVPVANFYSLTGAIVVGKGGSYKSLPDLLLAYRAKPNEVNFATIGAGSYPDMFLAWLNQYWNTKIEGVPYKGGGPISLALMSGEVQFSAAALGNFMAQIKGGTLDAIAVSSSTRVKALPQVPTYAEVGLSDFQGRLWWGVFAPAGTPASVAQQFNQVLNELLRTPAFVDYLETQGAEATPGTPEDFAKYVKADQDWTKTLLRSIGK
jgi:tripartite-type tricarboxylate transporter receptor subunit TctC